MFFLLVTSIILYDVSTNAANSVPGDILESVAERLNLLEEEFFRISKVETENKKLKSFINQQKTELKALTEENDGMKIKIMEQNGRIKTLEKQVLKLHNAWNEIYGGSLHNFNYIGDDNEHIMKSRKYMERNIQLSENTKKGSVAFAAIADSILTVNADTKIPFGYTQLNEGNSYNTSSGVFVCPSSGLYLFSYHILTFSSGGNVGSAAGVWLKVNNLPILMTVENAPNNATTYNLHGTTIARLNDGDQVWVGSGINGTIVMMIDSNFAGVRLSD